MNMPHNSVQLERSQVKRVSALVFETQQCVGVLHSDFGLISVRARGKRGEKDLFVMLLSFLPGVISV